MNSLLEALGHSFLCFDRAEMPLPVYFFDLV